MARKGRGRGRRRCRRSLAPAPPALPPTPPVGLRRAPLTPAVTAHGLRQGHLAPRVCLCRHQRAAGPLHAPLPGLHRRLAARGCEQGGGGALGALQAAGLALIPPAAGLRNAFCAVPGSTPTRTRQRPRPHPRPLPQVGLTSHHSVGAVPDPLAAPTDDAHRPDKHRAFALEGHGAWHALSASLAQQILGPVRGRAAPAAGLAGPPPPAMGATPAAQGAASPAD